LGGQFAQAAELAALIAAQWPAEAPHRFVVLTGGEPLLQVDTALIDALHGQGFEIAVETNGTIAAPAGLDWICVSPKQGSTLVQTTGHELKVVIPQAGQDLDALAALPFQHHLVQAMDGPLAKRNAQIATALCMADPRWRLSVQTHKVLGIR
jgi:7-carboxy-7-deazaguanine synthase (Cx14CxxC type)